MKTRTTRDPRRNIRVRSQVLDRPNSWVSRRRQTGGMLRQKLPILRRALNKRKAQRIEAIAPVWPARGAVHTQDCDNQATLSDRHMGWLANKIGSAHVWYGVTGLASVRMAGGRPDTGRQPAAESAKAGV